MSRKRPNPLLKALEEKRTAERAPDDWALRECVDDYAQTMRIIAADILANITPQPESPIERALLLGFIINSFLVPMWSFEGSRFRLNKSLVGPTVDVQPQALIQPYRVDFLLTVFREDEQVGTIIVECDGHDFHERTKDQAARDRSRDRALTLAGHTVLRFTGSEIYGSIGGCVDEVLGVIQNIYRAKK